MNDKNGRWKLPTNQRDSILLLREHWRVLLTVGLFQIAGVAISSGLVKALPDPFMNQWMGGACASLPGTLLGILWHTWNRERRAEANRMLLIMMTLLSAILPAFGLWFLYLQNLHLQKL